MISKKKNNKRKYKRRYKIYKYGGHKCECTAKCSNSNKSKSNLCSSASGINCTPNSHSGKFPFSIASHKS